LPLWGCLLSRVISFSIFLAAQDNKKDIFSFFLFLLFFVILFLV